jgi:hypothetical protein
VAHGWSFFDTTVIPLPPGATRDTPVTRGGLNVQVANFPYFASLSDLDTWFRGQVGLSAGGNLVLELPGSPSFPAYGTHEGSGTCFFLPPGYTFDQAKAAAESNATQLGGYQWVFHEPAGTLLPSSLQWDPQQGGIDFRDSVGDASTPRATTVALYWSSSQQFADRLGSPVYSRAVPAGTAVGSYGPFHVPAATLGPPPQGAQYLLAVTDPLNALGTFDGSKNVLPLLATPDIVMDQATSTDGQTVSVDYDITGANVNDQPLTFAVYRTSTPAPSGHPAALVTLPASDVADLAEGHHAGVELVLPDSSGAPLRTDPRNQFVVVVANADGAVRESDAGNEQNDTAYFQKHLLGVVVHGFQLFGFASVPTWETKMVASLVDHGYAPSSIAFDWVRQSSTTQPGQAVVAGDGLYHQVVAAAKLLAGQHPGDVVDLHVIGHSRGAVVAGIALKALVANPYPAIAGGYVKLTLLDPHPANNFNGTAHGYDAANGPIGHFLERQYLARQDKTLDPQVTIPANVDEVEDYYQQTPASAFPFYSFEHHLNIWGEPPDVLDNLSGQTIDAHPLTGRLLTEPGAFRPIGHTEVHDWYQQNVIDNGQTFSPPPEDPANLQVHLLVHSPVGLLLVDPQGRRLGYDPGTGGSVNDFGPVASDSGPGTEPEVLTLPLSQVVRGVYHVGGVGTGAGPYRIELQITVAGAPDGVLWDATLASGEAVAGQPIAPIPPVNLEDLVQEQVPTSVVLASDHPVGAPYGVPITFTATVSAGAGTPTGSVQLQVDGTDFGLAVGVANGVARLDAVLPAGGHAVTAVYTSDSPNFSTSASPEPLVLTITPASTTTAVAAGPFAEGGTAVVTVTVTDPDLGTQFFPSGMVTLTSSNASDTFSPSATASLAPTATPGVSSAQFTIAVPEEGGRTLTAGYAGTTTYLASNGTATLNVADFVPMVGVGADVSIRNGQGVARTGSFIDPSADTWTATVDYGDGTQGPLPLGPGPTFALNHLYTAVGDHTVTVTVTDDEGVAGHGSLVVHDLPPAQVQRLLINDGSAQRSMIDSITITFSTQVTIGAGAFQLLQVQPNGAVVDVSNLLRFSTSVTADQRTVETLTFAGGWIGSRSLADGRYTLTIHSNLVHDHLLGAPLDGDGDGWVGGDAVTQFFRLFGDVSGDGKVDDADLAAFQAAYRSRRGMASFRWYLDYDSNGLIDSTDYYQFLRRYKTSI